MAIVFRDGMDYYRTAQLLNVWTGITFTSNTGSEGNAAISAAGGRRGGSCLLITMAGPYSGGINTSRVQKTVTTSGAVAIVGMAVYTPAIPGSIDLLSIVDGSTVQTTVRLNSNATFSVYRGTGSGTLLATSSATLTAGVWTYLEFKVTLNASSGTYELRKNGQAIIGPTNGSNTNGAGTTTWNALWVGCCKGDGVGQGTSVSIDDLYCEDGTGSAPQNGFLGDVRIDAIFPSANGATVQWTPSTGSNNAATIDEVPPSGTDYNSTGSVGFLDTLIMQPPPVLNATVYEVAMHAFLNKQASGTATVAPIVRTSGVNYIDSDWAPGLTSDYFTKSYPTNPATGTAWTTSQLLVTELGYQKTS